MKIHIICKRAFFIMLYCFILAALILIWKRNDPHRPSGELIINVDRAELNASRPQYLKMNCTFVKLYNGTDPYYQMTCEK